MALFDKYRVILAPMAGVSDSVFRSLCLEAGADLAFCEMVSAKGLSYANEKTRHLLDLGNAEQTVGVQLFGHEPETMASQAAWVEDELGDRLAYIDINMGCPARKIVSKGDGAALMCDADLAGKIVSAVNSAVDHPVTCKFRRGWDSAETAPEFAKHMEGAGASAVAVHGRFAKQMYKGSANWQTIAHVKSSITIPVVGNGDIKSGEDALRMIEETACDAVMIARAAEGNPWIFSQVKAALEGKAAPAFPTAKDKIETARRHAKLLAEKQGDDIRVMRKHSAWYVSGMAGAAAARGKFNYCTTLQDFEKVFDELLERVENAA